MLGDGDAEPMDDVASAREGVGNQAGMESNDSSEAEWQALLLRIRRQSHNDLALQELHRHELVLPHTSSSGGGEEDEEEADERATDSEDGAEDVHEIDYDDATASAASLLQPGDEWTHEADRAMLSAFRTFPNSVSDARNRLVQERVLSEVFSPQMVLDRFIELCTDADAMPEIQTQQAQPKPAEMPGSSRRESARQKATTRWPQKGRSKRGVAACTTAAAAPADPADPGSGSVTTSGPSLSPKVDSIMPPRYLSSTELGKALGRAVDECWPGAEGTSDAATGVVGAVGAAFYNEPDATMEGARNDFHLDGRKAAEPGTTNRGDSARMAFRNEQYSSNGNTTGL